MRRIDKSTSRNVLTDYAQEFPEATWSDFRDYNGGECYSTIKQKIFSEQSELCAYCEVGLKNEESHNKRIEHFISKSDVSTQINVHLDWFNLIGVCLGGTDFKNKEIYELPDNLSCDSHKAYLEDVEGIVDKNWNGKVLCPLSIPDGHYLFCFEKESGKLLPNEGRCLELEIDGNTHDSTLKLVEETIRVFNLNCERLNAARLKLFHQLHHKIKEARKSGDMGIIERFVMSWKREFPLFFQTSRDVILQDNKITAKYLR
ncbi:retron Ec78 anti-phage system effector HNH endonuclease PtuB [Vibrio europaeus]|uniref:retron Ec78 anti-phage system effector HNH endonuclease PtuB n=1 Tax=Vibrio europaeus TaxID=300876 RepID=UPI00233F2B2D|nr:retron Ec78 anti-phage system effector HNH endonuclease PtuB [Vibrio europaeus]MDC5854884.1 TIGR02646 family protein [Vibrio europaeus]